MVAFVAFPDPAIGILVFAGVAHGAVLVFAVWAYHIMGIP